MDNLFSPIVFRKYVLSRLRALNDLSAVHDDAGIVAKILAASDKCGKRSLSLCLCKTSTRSEADFTARLVWSARNCLKSRCSTANKSVLRPYDV